MGCIGVKKWMNKWGEGDQVHRKQHNDKMSSEGNNRTIHTHTSLPSLHASFLMYKIHCEIVYLLFLRRLIAVTFRYHISESKVTGMLIMEEMEDVRVLKVRLALSAQLPTLKQS